MRMPGWWLVFPVLVCESRCLITDCLTETAVPGVVDGPQTVGLLLLRLPYTAPIRIGVHWCLTTDPLNDADLPGVVDGPQNCALLVLRLPCTASIRIGVHC